MATNYDEKMVDTTAAPQGDVSVVPNHDVTSGDVPDEVPKRNSVGDGDEDEEQVLREAPDGGWGWVVVFGSFMIHVIADGFVYSFGIYVKLFLEHFHRSRSEVGFLGSLMLGVTWGSGPILSMLTNKFGFRKVTIVGSIVAVFGLIISIFAPNIYFMYFSFGIVAGFGLGMVYLPAIVAVSFYFEKRRSLATGLAVCGSGVGTLISAPVTQFLLDEYGWKGTVLIEAGIILNCIPCGAVFRPLPVTTSAVQKAYDDPETAAEMVEKPQFSSSSTSLAFRKEVLKDVSSCRKISKSETHFDRGARLSVRYSVWSDESPSVVALGPMARKDIFYTASLCNIPLFNSDMQKYRRSMVHIPPLPEDDNVVVRRGCRCLDMIGCSGALKEMMNCCLMLDVIFQLFAISSLLMGIAFCVPYVFLPNRAMMLGMSESEGAFLISIIGISNTIGRLVFGFLADFKWVNRLMLFSAVLVLCGVCSLLSALCFNYPLMAAYSASFGLFFGVVVCLTPIVLVDLLGLEKLSNSFGLVLLFLGIGAVIGPPMAGALYDSTKDYNNSFYLMGACLIVGGMMLYVISLIQRYRNRRNLRLLENAADRMTASTSTTT